jgi:hypothetical protein
MKNHLLEKLHPNSTGYARSRFSRILKNLTEKKLRYVVPAGICAHLVNWGAVEIILNWPHFIDGDARLAMALIDPRESPPVHEKRVILVRNLSTKRSRQPPILSLVSLYPTDFFSNPAPLPCFYGTTKLFIS